MSANSAETTVEILGKTYQIKCPAAEVDALQRAAEYLQEKMRHIHDGSGIMHLDRVAVIAALNVVHQLLTFESQKENYIQNIHQRLRDLHNKIEHALAPVELSSAE
ncbi:MAG: hypothetical protein ACD_60C00026G0003 [uncultured bacterium]|nr:MAG: hypothetical protein ACD_60C00026G0003 [uncultured bacterium]